MRFYFFLKPVGELVQTSVFTIASKQPPPPVKPRKAPKRVRGPPPRRPFHAVAEGAEVTLNAMLARTLATAKQAPAVPAALMVVPAPEETKDDAQAPLKRVRRVAPAHVLSVSVPVPVTTAPLVLPVGVPPVNDSATAPAPFAGFTDGLDAGDIAAEFADELEMTFCRWRRRE